MNEHVAALHLHVWEVTNEAMLLSWDKTTLPPEDKTALGEQVALLLRVLARRGIVPRDPTDLSSSPHKEN